MAKGKKKSALGGVNGGSNQEELFAPEPGSFDVADRLRAEMKRAIRESPLSRYEIAGKMSELLGRDITKSMIDAWLAESKEWRNIKAIDLNAFCQVTGTISPFRVLLFPLAADVVVGEDLAGLELVQIRKKQKKLEAKELELRKRVGL